MIQLNLLPDVKLEYIKARRDKRTIILIASFVIIVSLGITALMVSFVYVGQKQHLKHLDNDTDKGISKIQNTQGINEMLTIQNQLSVVNDKHQEKPDATRILNYLATVLPPEVTTTQINVDFANSTLSIDGTSPNITSTNKLVDTLKFVEYTLDSNKDANPKPKAFSGVVLAGYSEKDGKSTYSITMTFDPVIFKNTETVSLNIPGIVSTRSSTEKPVINFDAKTNSTTQGQQ